MTQAGDALQHASGHGMHPDAVPADPHRLLLPAGCGCRRRHPLTVLSSGASTYNASAVLRAYSLLTTSIFERGTRCRESQNMKGTRKTNPVLVALISDLKKAERETGSAIWRDIAVRLEKPSRNWAETNLSRLERYANEGETILVPGKVLAAGSISKKLTVAAYSFSAAAAEGIEAAGGKAVSIRDLMAENPKGSNVRIMR